MKPFLYSLLLVAAFGPQIAKADITLTAPGVTTSQSVTSLPFKTEVTIQAYKYSFTGMEAKGNTLGAPGSSGDNGNGGQFHLTGKISSSLGGDKEGGIYFRDEQDYNTSPLVTTTNATATVITATSAPVNVTIQWKGEGNAKTPTGFFNINGCYQAAPAAPTGSLTFSNVSSTGYIEKDKTPQGTVKITRD